MNILKKTLLTLVLVSTILAVKAQGDDKKKEDLLSSSTFSALKFRSIGPAYASGRIADIEVNPNNFSEYYIAAASGNVWKTVNNGITFAPIFENYGSYSTSDVAIDPNNTNVVWVATGEYNGQRAIGYGDGVYRSADGGKKFVNMGLKNSSHIGRVVIDPRNSHVYVAAQGPLWGAGGDRGLYKTEDNGKTWNKILEVSENTGITDIVFDPRNPDILYAASYQRRRRVWTFIGGGPESRIYKSEDAGKTWRKLKSGLPSGDMGRIGLTISPANPDYIYAIIELPEKKGGTYRSIDRGESWTKMSDYSAGAAMYYNRLFADPKDENKIYSVDTYSKYSLDGGKNWKNFGLKQKHVDDHALWINPKNTNHLIICGDGGIYDTYDFGSNWRHVPNLPITQYYRIAIDNSYPFYNICGGTQDNNSMVGPSQTISSFGIVNSDWKTTRGGDGFFAAFDPKNPDIVYSEAQYGWLVRYDKKSGERFEIRPTEPKGETYTWNWNAPLLISPHNHKRLYFAANKVFRSDSRGDKWDVISPDLTRKINRNELKVMGKVQNSEAVAKNASTSIFGNIVSLTESPLKENLLYAGTDDGLVQVTEDAGKNWRKVSKFGNVPDMTYVSCLLASQHEEDVIYSAFDGRKNNDLKPYILKSSDKGKTWKSISGNLPERGTVYTIAEDHKNKNLLFVGTEFGIFFTLDGGSKWIQLKAGLPTIPVRDIKIQKRENDIAIATFGRGFYILDDYSLLQDIAKQDLEKEALLFPVKDAKMFVRTGVKYGQGATYYAGKNPAFGATFTYYLKENVKTKRQIRKDKEKEATKAGKDITYPTFEELKAEDSEEKAYLLFTIRDSENKIIRRMEAPAKAGMNRISWGLRSFATNAVTKNQAKAFNNQKSGMPVMPGKYTVELSKVINGTEIKLGLMQSFNAVPLNLATLTEKDKTQTIKLQKEAQALYKAVSGLNSYLDELSNELKTLKIALKNTPEATLNDITAVNEILDEVKEIKIVLNGDKSISSRNGGQTPSVVSRIDETVYGIWKVTCAPSQTMFDNLNISKEILRTEITTVKELAKQAQELQQSADKKGSPWSKGRIPSLD